MYFIGRAHSLPVLIETAMVVNISVAAFILIVLSILTDFCHGNEPLYVNESYCCDSGGNIVFSNFTKLDQDYLSIEFTEKHAYIHSGVEALCNLIFSSDLPQGDFARLFKENSKENHSVSLDDIREVIHDYGWENIGYTLFIWLGCAYIAAIFIVIIVIVVLRCLKKAFTELKFDRVWFWTHSLLSLLFCGLMIVSVSFWHASWTELSGNYPNSFVFQVRQINDNLQLLLNATVKELDSLRDEQRIFAFQQVDGNLNNLPSITFQPVEDKILGDIGSPLSQFITALDDAKAQWKDLLNSYDAMMNATEDATFAVSNAFEDLSAMGCSSNDAECQSAQALIVPILSHRHSFAVSILHYTF